MEFPHEIQLLVRDLGQVGVEKFLGENEILFVPHVPHFQVQAVQLKREIGEHLGLSQGIPQLEDLLCQRVRPAFDAAGDVLPFGMFFKLQGPHGQGMEIPGFGAFFGFGEDVEALPVQPFVVQDAGIVDHFADLDVGFFLGAQQAQAGQQLFVQMGFQVGKLLLFDFRQLAEDGVFFVLASFFEEIEQL